MTPFISLLGIVTLLLTGWLLSSQRSAIRPRVIAAAFSLQFLISLLVLYVPMGRRALLSASQFITHILAYSERGSEFLFGPLVSQKMFELFGNSGFIFAFRVLPVIIFIASFMSVLYYTGIMTYVIRLIGGALALVLGTSKTESLSSTANLFFGLSEAPLVIRPYIPTLTRSELFAVMTGGLASCSGSTLAGYAALGISVPYLIAAAFMSAPAGLLFAKLMEPETQTPTLQIQAASEQNRPANIIEAAANGAAEGLKLALNIGAMLLAFISLIAVLNAICSGIGGWFGYSELSLQYIFGWIFSPVAFLLGVPSAELHTVASLIGEKTILNEFVAFMHLAPYLTASTGQLSEISVTIATFALCGFANIGSIAMLIGGIGSLAPNRRHDIATMGIRAIVAATLANLMSAAIAGLIIGVCGSL